MVYFYHHYELPYVLQQAQLQQVIIQRQQQQHQHQHQHQPTGGDSLRPEGRSPVEVTIRPVQHFSLMNGLNNLGRLRAVLLRRRRVRTFEPPPPPTVPTPSTNQQNTSSQSTPSTTLDATGSADPENVTATTPTTQ